MLSISGVTKRYGKTLANDNISFAVGDGQIGILLGPNGAGKVHHHQVHYRPFAVYGPDRDQRV